MKKVKQIEPDVGVRYSSAEGKVFTITGLPELNKDQWVEYVDAQNKKDYYCRLEAFLQRFHPIAD